jgi:GTP cyclohydrolase FolE2
MNLIRKSKNLLKLKRKENNSEYWSVSGASSTKTESTKQGQSLDAATGQIEAAATTECPCSDTTLPEDAQVAWVAKSEEGSREEIQVKG